jgi:hypothetical protein
MAVEMTQTLYAHMNEKKNNLGVRKAFATMI